MVLHMRVSYSTKRKNLKAALRKGKLLRFVGSFSPLVSLMIEEIGFDGIYISGSVLSNNDLGMPDIGLLSQTELCQKSRQIARVSQLPSMVDIDTGFGSSINVARTVVELQELGLSACHIEDQVSSKRCGHLENKSLIPIDEMETKIQAAKRVKTDSNFTLIARTDARSVEGLKKSIERAQRYVEAGADMIFPEALQSLEEFKEFRRAIHVPLMANMTEFGKSPLLNAKELEALGYNVVLYPVTTLRLAMKAVEDGLREILHSGSQEKLLEKMQSRKELYKITQYETYDEFDKGIFDFRG